MPSTLPPANERSETSRFVLGGNAPTITGALASNEPPSHPPPVIPGYKVVRELGRGGMGEVYEVVSEKLDVTFALKTIRPDRVSKRFLNRFLTEARTMTQLDHPHIARIYFYGETDDGPYFTMRYLPDGTLDERMADFQKDPKRAIGLMADIAGAVEYLHKQGFIHRDLKPHNILFVNDVPYVSDFGLAKEFGDDAEGSCLASPATGTVDNLSQAETVVRDSDQHRPYPAPTYGVVGTLPYMSPEQLLNRAEKVSAKTDIWALGVMLHELLTGRRPFESEDREILSELIKTEEPYPMRVGDAPIDLTLERVIRKCLAKNPDDRYESAALLERDLRDWLAAANRPAAKPPRFAWLARHPMWTIGSLATVAAAVVLAVIYWPKPAPPEDPIVQAKKRLREGQAITFVGEQWPPALPLNVISGKDRAVIRESGDRCVTVEAHQPILVQFFDDPGIDSYTFRIQVRYNGRDFGERVGIYVGHQKFSTPDGDKHFFLPLSFTDNERSPDAPKGLKKEQVQLSGIREIQAALLESRVGAAGSFKPYTFKGGRHSFPRPKHDGESEWHKLEVIARPNQWEFRFDGATASKVPVPLAEHVIDALQGFHKGGEPLPLQLNPRGGLGLFIQSGTASFRNAEIIPDIASIDQ